jgi:hypothetical protein
MCPGGDVKPEKLQAEEVQYSSGWHFLEFHLPSAGISAFSVFLMLGFALCIYLGYQRCRRSSGTHSRRRRSQDQGCRHSDFPVQHYSPPPGQWSLPQNQQSWSQAPSWQPQTGRVSDIANRFSLPYSFGPPSGDSDRFSELPPSPQGSYRQFQIQQHQQRQEPPRQLQQPLMLQTQRLLEDQNQEQSVRLRHPSTTHQVRTPPPSPAPTPSTSQATQASLDAAAARLEASRTDSRQANR